jgi:hypothetical protein
LYRAFSEVAAERPDPQQANGCKVKIRFRPRLTALRPSGCRNLRPSIRHRPQFLQEKVAVVPGKGWPAGRIPRLRKVLSLGKVLSWRYLPSGTQQRRRQLWQRCRSRHAWSGSLGSLLSSTAWIHGSGRITLRHAFLFSPCCPCCQIPCLSLFISADLLVN